MKTAQVELATIQNEKIQTGHSSKKSGKLIDAILLAYLYLVESVSTVSESALVKAKQMQGNAASQEQANNQAAQLKWYSIPQADIHHFNIKKKYGHWVATAGGGMKFKTTHIKLIPRTTIKNLAQVKIIETRDEDQQQVRQILGDKAQVLQQQASITMNQVNSDSDQAVSTIQEGSSLMDIATSLTFKALLRNQPSD